MSYVLCLIITTFTRLWQESLWNIKLFSIMLTLINHSHNTHDNMHHSSSSTKYYVTFEFESGDRLELHVASNEYGYLVEGDMGKLTFQGTRYKNFERTK